jgi:hypothetical protein
VTAEDQPLIDWATRYVWASLHKLPPEDRAQGAQEVAESLFPGGGAFVRLEGEAGVERGMASQAALRRAFRDLLTEKLTRPYVPRVGLTGLGSAALVAAVVSSVNGVVQTGACLFGKNSFCPDEIAKIQRKTQHETMASEERLAKMELERQAMAARTGAAAFQRRLPLFAGGGLLVAAAIAALVISR